MKKIILIPTLTAFCGILFTMNAQINITSANYYPGAGIFYQNIDTLPVSGIVPGNAGASQTYDFSALHNLPFSTNEMIAPSAGILPGKFPSADVCWHLDTMYSYFDSSSTKLELLGVAGNLLMNGVNNALVYSNAQTIITFPSTYQTAFTDVAAYDNKFAYGALYQGYMVDSVREKETITTTSLIDGWGTVTTPLATSVPCLRQNIVKQSIDSTWAKVVVGGYHYWLNLSGDATSTQSYSYISATNGHMVDIDYYADSNAIYQVRWNDFYNGIAQNETDIDFNVFPNPNSGEFSMTLNSPVNNNFKIELNNMLGQVIYSESLNSFSGKYSKSFNVKEYGEGMYFLRVSNGSGLVKSSKIAIVH